MSQIEKLIGKFIKNSASIKYRDLKKIFEYIGLEEVSTKGSHVKFKHYSLKQDLIIPVHNNECKDFYKLQAKKTIKNLL